VPPSHRGAPQYCLEVDTDGDTGAIAEAVTTAVDGNQMQQLAYGLGADLALVAILVAIVLIAAVAYSRYLRRLGLQARDVRARLQRVALVGWLVLVLAVTLVPTGPLGGQRSVNLVPAYGLDAPWRSSISAGNMVGNILLFAPFGFLLPLIFASFRSFVRLGIIALSAPLAVEAAQYVLAAGRSADINDALLNLTGVLLGWACYSVGRRLKRSGSHAAGTSNHISVVGDR
jgi:glycopeptide antibiotics resistance protein